MQAACLGRIDPRSQARDVLAFVCLGTEYDMDEDVRTPEATERIPETEIEHETHATTGGAAAAGALVAGAIGLTGGPVAAVVGAVGGAIVGAAAERMMHSEDDRVASTVYQQDTTDRKSVV